MIELGIASNSASLSRLSPGAEFHELSDYLGRFIKIEGIAINSLGELQSERIFSRAGKLIALSGRGFVKEYNRNAGTSTGITIEGFKKIDLNFDSPNLRISVLQSDAGIWKVIHEPKSKKNK